MSPEAKTRRIWLGRIWLWLRWILFLPAGLSAGVLVYYAGFEGAGLRSTTNEWYLGLFGGAVTGVAVYVSKLLCPSPLLAAALVAMITLVPTLWFLALGAGWSWLVGWALGVAAATFVTFRRLAAEKKERHRLRWFLFYPSGFVAGVATVAAVFFGANSWHKASTSATISTDEPVFALISNVAAFLASTAYVLVGGMIAPSNRAIVVVLMSAISYLVAFVAGNELAGWRPFQIWLAWLAGTALGTLPALMRAPAAQEPWRRLAGAVEGKGRRYKGTAPYQDLDLDRKTFFGRERETRHFLNLVLAERLVVLFAKSGMGKSSLINAGILEPLRQQGYFPFVVRINDTGQTPSKALIDGARRTAKDENVDIAGGEETGLWQFFKTAEFWSERDDLLRPVMVLDQFEELFTLHNAWVRKEFTSQLAELVRGRVSANRQDEGETPPKAAVDDTAPNLKIVIALREDFLANLEDLSAEIPAILHNRFRLGPLSAKAARDAIVEPAGLAGEVFETGRFSYQEAAVERMIAFLAKRRMGTESAEDDEVEPVQLQLICHYLEETVQTRQSALKGDAEIQISEADLGGDEQMRQVLEGFYDRTIASVRAWHKRRAVRRLCEHRLISGSGRRLTEDEEEIQSRYSISGELLRQLVDARLLRAEPRLGGTFYEISHDRLVEPILASRRRRASRMRRIAAAAVPLVLAVSISQAWRGLERQHQETEIRAHLLEVDALKAIQSAGQLARSYGYHPETLLGLAEPVLNPAAFVIFTKPPMDLWKWNKPDQAKKVFDHIRRSYQAFLRASPESKEVDNARVFLGAVVSTLDQARAGTPAAAEAGELQAEVLDSYRRKFRRAGQDGCAAETAVVVQGGERPLRIQQFPVTSDLYEGCLEPPVYATERGQLPAQKSMPAGQVKVAEVIWFEAVAYAALREGRLPSGKELESAKGRIGTVNRAEWLQDDEPGRIVSPFGFGPSTQRRPFRVIWDLKAADATAVREEAQPKPDPDPRSGRRRAPGR